MIVTQISAELVLTIWSEETARPTVAATSPTAGSAASSRDVRAASRSSSGKDMPSAPVQWMTRLRSWNCGVSGCMPGSTARVPSPARHSAARTQRGIRSARRSVAR